MRRRNQDDKFESLIQKGALNAKPQVVIDELFAAGGFFDPHDVVQVKYEMLRRVANGQSVAEALRAFGFSSHHAFYKARAAFEQSGLAGLIPGRRGPRKRNEVSRTGKEQKNSLSPAGKRSIDLCLMIWRSTS